MKAYKLYVYNEGDDIEPNEEDCIEVTGVFQVFKSDPFNSSPSYRFVVCEVEK